MNTELNSNDVEECSATDWYAPEPGPASDTDHPEPLAAPNPLCRDFGHYRLIQALGHGGMGVVYRAYDTKLRRHVAIKLVVNEEGLTPMMRRRFSIGAEAAARLDHPNIVPIYEIGEIDRQPYFSMKLIEGVTLRQQLVSQAEAGADGRARHGAADQQRQAARLIALIAHAIHHAHQNNVLHRDLKPGNILIDPSGKPYLTDFGLAKFFQGAEVSDLHRTESLPGTVMGTPCYMSPEQASGFAASPASDIYSLGVVLYELLAGQPPFRAATPFDTMRQIVEDEPARLRQRNPSIDRELETLCLKCLEKDPQRRYATAEILAEELERWLRGEPIKTPTASRWHRLRKWAYRNPLGAWLILSLVIGFILTLTGLFTASVRAQHLRELTNLWVHDWMRQTQDAWTRPDPDPLLVTSEMLHLLVNNIAGRDASPRSQVRLGLAIQAKGHPVIEAYHIAPLLVFLERQLASRLPHRVLLDLRLIKPDQPFHSQTMPASVHLIWLDQDWTRQTDLVSPDFQLILKSAPDASSAGAIVARALLGPSLIHAFQEAFQDAAAQKQFSPRSLESVPWKIQDASSPPVPGAD